MGNRSRFALRWGAPVALAAVAIAALLVAPVFGGRAKAPSVQTIAKYIPQATVQEPSARSVGSLGLNPGNYVVTMAFHSITKTPSTGVYCSLYSGKTFLGTAGSTEPGVPNGPPFTTHNESTTVGLKLHDPSTLKVKCATDVGKKALLLDIRVIATEVPKLTIHKAPLPN